LYDSADDSEWRSEVNVKHGVPLLVACLLDTVVPDISGVVHEDVNAPEPTQGRVDESFGELQICDAS